MRWQAAVTSGSLGNNNRLGRRLVGTTAREGGTAVTRRPGKAGELAGWTGEAAGVDRHGGELSSRAREGKKTELGQSCRVTQRRDDDARRTVASAAGGAMSGGGRGTVEWLAAEADGSCGGGGESGERGEEEKEERGR